MSTTRPGLYPLHDLLGTNFIAPENSLFLQSGYPVNLPVPSADHNGKFNRSGLWHQYLDLNGIRNADWLDIGATQTLSSTTLAYNFGGNVLTTGATVLTRGVHLVGGTRIETDAAFLNPVGGVQGNPLIYPGAITPGRIWVYASSTGVVRYESVAAGVADSPAGSEVTLVGLRLDALGDVIDGALTPTTALPARQLSVTIPLSFTAAALVITGDVVIGGELDVTSAGTFHGGLAVEGLITEFGETATLVVDGDAVVTGEVKGDTLEVTGNASIGGNLDMTSGNLLNVNTIGAGDITCTGLAASAAITAGGAIVGLTLEATNSITCGGNLDMTSGSIANVTTITAATVDTSSSAGIVKPGEIQFYSDATPSTTTGVMQFFGRGLSVGINGTAKRVSIPYDNYVAAPADTNSATATGASISVTLVTGDVVIVEASADLTNTGASSDEIHFEIAIDGVNQNSPGRLTHPAANEYITCRRTVAYVAPGNAIYTFVQRYGANTNTTKCRNSWVSVRLIS